MPMPNTGAVRRRTTRGTAAAALAAVAALSTTGALLPAPAAAAAPAAAGPRVAATSATPTVPGCFRSLTGTLTAGPSTIDSRQLSRLSWSVPGAPRCRGTSVLLGSRAVPARGAQLVRPVITTTYTLSAAIPVFNPELRRVVRLTKRLATRTVTVRGTLPVSVQLRTFRADNADEDSWYSNGDEPYLMVFPVFVDGTTVNLADARNATVRVLSAPRTHRNLNRTGVDGGDSFPVPADTGRFATSILPVRGVPTAIGERVATVALVVVALEEDGTPHAAAAAGRAAAQAELRRQVEALVRRLQIPDASSVAQVQAAVRQKVRDAIKRETLARFGLFGVLDPDDYVGTQVVNVSYADLRAASTAGIPVRMTFSASGVRYRVEGSIARR